MPRKKSENTEAINLKVSKLCIKRADKHAAANGPVKATRSAILRLAIEKGLDAMDAEKKRGKTK